MNSSPYLFYRIVLVCSLSVTMLHAQPAVTIDNLTLTVTSGLTLTVSGDFQNQNGGAINNSGVMAVSGNWTNNASNGVFNSITGKVQLNGTVAPQTIGGNYSTSFYDLTLNNSATDTTRYILGAAQTVRDTLALTGGATNLAGYLLTLGSSGPSPGGLLYSAGWLYGGSFIRWLGACTIADGAVAGLFPLGTATDYRPYNISAPTTAPSLGGTISVAHVGAAGTTPSSFTDINETIDRVFNSYWAISTGNGLVGGTYNIQAGGTGFTGITDSSVLRLVQLGSAAGSYGVNAGTNSNPAVKRTGLTALQLSNYFYIGYPSGYGPLPVSLLEFSAKPDESTVRLHWETASEINSDYFTVERSADGETYDILSTVPAAGTSFEVKDYSLTDDKPLFGTSFYRLKETDYDGRYTYYAPIEVNFNSLKSEFEIVSTRSLNGQIIITILSSVNENFDLDFYDSTGRLIVHKSDNFNKGYQDVTIPFKDQIKGMYFVTLRTADRIVSKKML